MSLTWNYRLFREENSDLVFREVFYDDNGEILTCSRDPIELWGESIDAITTLLEDLRAAITQPILTLADVPKHPPAPAKSSPQRTFSSQEAIALLLGKPDGDPDPAPGDEPSTPFAQLT